MGEPAYQLPEDDKPDIRPDLHALEGGGETSEPRRGHLRSADDDKSLVDQEREGDDAPDHGPSALDNIKSQLGRGYTNDDKKSMLSRAFNSKSKIKKRVAIAGVLAAGSIGGSILLFFLMLPLK